MLVFILILIILISTRFVYTYAKNRIQLAMLISMIGFTLVIVSGFLYVYKFNSSYTPKGIDKIFFDISVPLPLNISFILSVYNIGFVLMMFSSVLLFMLFYQNTIITILLTLPIIFWGMVNSPNCAFELFLKFQSGIASNMFWVKFIAYASCVISLIYTFLPGFLLIHYAYSTKIKRISFSLCLYAIYFMTINIYVYVLFLLQRLVQTSRSAFDQFGFAPPKINAISINSFAYIMFFIVVILIFSMMKFMQIPFAKYLYFFPQKKKINMLQTDLNNSMKIIFHRYKNTFAAIEKFSEYLEQSVDTSPETAKLIAEKINAISKESIQTIRSVVDAIDIDISDKSSKIKTADLCEILEDVIEKLPVNDDISVTLNCSANQRLILCDVDLIAEGFNNLLNNAIEAITLCKKSGKQSISVTLYNEQKYIICEITDTGPGISPNKQESIFEPFYTDKSGNKNFGLGLYYSKRVFETHSGTIQVVSKDENGSTFQVVLPYKVK